MHTQYTCAGHVGREKTTESITNWFYWLDIHKGVRNYCMSCLECQLKWPKNTPRASQILMPLIGTLFERIGMDLIRPVEKSVNGHQHILIVDHAMWYPKAILLCTTNAVAMVAELTKIFVRVGTTRK